MKKLSFADLTHDLLKELSALGTAQEIKRACEAKSLDISEQDADRLKEQIKKAKELSKENIEKVAGGGVGYSGTRALSNAFARRAAACGSDCWDGNGNGIDDDQDPYFMCGWDLNFNGIDDDYDHSGS